MFIKKAFSLLSFLLFCMSANATPILPLTYSLDFLTSTENPSLATGGHAGGSFGRGFVNKSDLPDILLGNFDFPIAPQVLFQNGFFNIGSLGFGGTITSVGEIITDPTIRNPVLGIDLFRTFSGTLRNLTDQTSIGDFTVNWHYNGRLAPEDPRSPNYQLSGMLDMGQTCLFPSFSGGGIDCRTDSTYPDQIAVFTPYPIFSDKFYTTLNIKYNDNAPILFKGLNLFYSTTFPNDTPMTFRVTDNQLGSRELYNNGFRITATMNKLDITVPEPNSLMLVVSALTLFYLFNRRKQTTRINPILLV